MTKQMLALEVFALQQSCSADSRNCLNMTTYNPDIDYIHT